jgi:hypothetical protein
MGTRNFIGVRRCKRQSQSSKVAKSVYKLHLLQSPQRKKKLKILAPFFYRAHFPSWGTSFTGTQTEDTFCGCGVVTETRNFHLDAVLLSHLVCYLNKPSSPRLEHGTDFQGCGHCSCNLPRETKTFVLALFLYRT